MQERVMVKRDTSSYCALQSVPSFNEISLDFRVIVRTLNCMENNQREITPKI